MNNRIKSLGEILTPVEFEMIAGSPEVKIRGLRYDSRKVGPGDLFFCVKGFRFDGHDFIPDAIKAGAAALVVQKAPEPAVSVPTALVRDSRPAMGLVSAEFFGQPSRKLDLAGVTGTNGKTSVAFLTDGIRRHLGRKTGLLGTVINRIADQVLPVVHTTPESLDLQEFLARMVEAGCDSAVMEVSSHAVVLDRIAGCEFKTGIFTNITQDHLDFHKTFEDYIRAKAKFFSDYIDGGGAAVVNGDDPNVDAVIKDCKARVIRFGVGDKCDVRARNVDLSFTGTRFDLVFGEKSGAVNLRLLGEFNVLNALAAASAVLMEGAELEDVAAGLEACSPVPGRFEMVSTLDLGFAVIVDYAHTPDGLSKILSSARLITPSRVIAVFGCGGDRDRGKRPIMGEIGVRNADFAIITSDNPRTEDPEAIIRDILEGVKKVSNGTPNYLVEVDRKEAIRKAVMAAKPGDTVLIAGKGHENYQIFKDQTIHFDDRETAAEFIGERSLGTADSQ